MTRIKLADAKTQLSRLVERAAAGDQVCITRRGKPMAKLTAMDSPRKRIDPGRLRELTASMPRQKQRGAILSAKCAMRIADRGGATAALLDHLQLRAARAALLRALWP